MVEVNDIPRDSVTVPQNEMLKLMFCISYRVVGTKGFLELGNEVNPAVHPAWALSRRAGIQKVRLEPFQSHALEIGLGERYLCPVLAKSFWAVLET